MKRIGFQLCSALFLAIACTRTAPAPESQVRAERGNVRREVLADGTVFSPSAKPLAVPHIENSWDLNILSVVDEGTLVKPGDVVIEFDGGSLRRAIEDAEARVLTNRLRLEESRIDAENKEAERRNAIRIAEIELEKARLQVMEGVTVSKRKHEEQLLGVAAAERTLRRKKEDLESLRLREHKESELRKNDLAQAERQLSVLQSSREMLQLRAPQAGFVLLPAFRTNAGWVTARAGIGVNRGTVLAEVSPVDDLLVKAFVPEVDGDGIAPGAPAEVGFDRIAGLRLKGKVTAVSPIPMAKEEQSDGESAVGAIKQFEVTIRVESLPKTILPGMTARVALVPVERKNVVRIPVEMVAADDQRPRVWTRTGKGWEWRPVKLGAVSHTHAEILAGLKQGDEVALPPGNAPTAVASGKETVARF